MTSQDQSDRPLLVGRSDGVALLRLNRPEQRNSFDLSLTAAMANELAALADDNDIRVAVITGNGSAFCAGADLKGGPRAGTGAVLSGAAKRLTAAVDAFPKPIVAAVNGAAYGGGCELALAADLRVAAERATFCLPEVRIGSLAGSGGTQRLVNAVGTTVAAKMLYLGEPIDAAEAHRVGLVSDVFASDELVDKAMAIAGRIAANAPLSLLALKQALSAATPQAGLAFERALWGLLATTEDREEGRVAFREKRPPEYQSK